jgi:hypothetical protein
MHITVNLSDSLYRAVIAKAALEGRTVGDVLTQAVEQFLRSEQPTSAPCTSPTPRPWIGGLRKYAQRTAGSQTLSDMRASIAKARESGLL